MSIGGHHYLSNEMEMKLCIQKALSQSSEHIKKNLQNECKMVMNRYQFDISYNHEELGNDLYQLFKKIQPYNEIAQKLLCQYKPCQKLGYLLKSINSCIENIFAFLKTHTQQRKNYTEQNLRSLQQKLQIQVPGHCNRCRKFILSRDIQQTKVLIGVGQFNDPYNLYEAGTSDFINNNRIKQQDEEYKLKYAQVWQNKKKIQEKFRMMQLQFDKRSYGYTYSANQIHKLQSVIKNIISQGPNFEDQQYKTSHTFNGEVVKLVNKIYKKLKEYKQPDLYKDQEVQAGESEQIKIWEDLKSNNQKLTKKNQQLKKKLTQKEKQISETTTKLTKLEQQYSRCIFQANTNEQVMKNLVAQHVEAEKHIYQLGFDIKIKEEKVRQLDRQNQCLRSDIQKWLHHIQDKTGDREKRKPLKSLKSLISKNLIAEHNPTDEGQEKSPNISEKQYGSHDRENKRSSMLKRPLKKSITQLSSQNKDQTGQHSRRNNKKLTQIIEQSMASQRGQTQYEDGINEGTQVSIKVNQENSLDYYKKDQMQDFTLSTKKLRLQRSMKKILRKSQRKQQISNRSEFSNQQQQKLCQTKAQQATKAKNNKDSNSKSKSKQNSVKQSKQQKASKTSKQLKQKSEVQGLKNKIQKMTKKSPQSKNYQQKQNSKQKYSGNQQYIHEQDMAQIQETQYEQQPNKNHKSNSIYQYQRKQTKKSTRAREALQKKSINSMHSSGPSFQPLSSLNANNTRQTQSQIHQSKQYHTLFAQTLPDIHKGSTYTREDKSRTLNQCHSNDSSRNTEHKRSLQQFQCEQIYRRLYQYYLYLLQFYSQQTQPQQPINQQTPSQRQAMPTCLTLQQFSTRIQNYLKHLLKQSLSHLNQSDTQQQGSNPYINLNKALKISKFTSLSAYQNMLGNIDEQCYNQIGQKIDMQNSNGGLVYRNKKQSGVSSYSNVNSNTNNDGSYNNHNGHRRKQKESIMIIQKLTQKLTKLFFSQQQAYQIQKSKFTSFHNTNTLVYNPNTLNPNLNSSITMTKQTKKQLRHITPNAQLNQLLNRYEINYLKLTMILFVKLHNKYPQIYEIIKRNIMFAYSSNRCVVAVMGGTGIGGIDGINQMSRMGGMGGSVSSYAGLNKMQRKTMGYRQLQQLTSTVNGYGYGSNYMRQAVLKLIVLHRKCLNCNNGKKISTNSNHGGGGAASDGRGTSSSTHHPIDKDNTKGRDDVNSKFNGQVRNGKYICRHLLDFQRFIENEFQLSYEITEESKENQDNSIKESERAQQIIDKLEKKEHREDSSRLEIKGKNQFSKRQKLG